MEKSSQIAWKLVPLRHFFPLKVVPLIEVLRRLNLQWHVNRDPKTVASLAPLPLWDVWSLILGVSYFMHGTSDLICNGT
jgi:hypothetical protein